MSPIPYIVAFGVTLCFAICESGHLIAESLSAQTAQLAAIATELKLPLQTQAPPLNAECHETLGLFDEWLKHDLRTGGSGRK